jgi:putative FmdB family regulatory protein
MPLYEYRCNQCGRRFTLLVGMTATKPKRACPRCGSRKLSKLISRIAAIGREDELDDLGDSEFEGGDDLGDDYGDDLE